MLDNFDWTAFYLFFLIESPIETIFVIFSSFQEYVP